MSPRRRRAALASVQAAYRVEGSTEEWLAGLLEAARPALGQGHGMYAFTFRITADGRFRSDSTVVGDVDAEFAESVVRLNESLAPPLVAASFADPCALDTASAAYEATTGQPFREFPGFSRFREVGIHDGLAAKAVGPERAGLVVAAALAEEQTVARETRVRWSRVMTHLLAAQRLRRRLADSGCAVLEPGGRVVHAEGEARRELARAALREAAHRRDRSRARGDADASLEAWTGLVSGRWSLVDRFDSDGRRFLIARRNDPEICGSALLSRRERQVLAFAALGYSNKRIAYAMGLAPSTISSHLRAGMRKLGATEHGDIARLFQWSAADLTSDS